MRTGSIYIIKNTVNDKVYIGQTTMTVHERFMTHMKPSTVKSRGNYKLYYAVNKYGIPIKKRESFNYESILKDYYSQMPIGELCVKYEITKTTFYRIKEDKKFATRPQIYANKIRYRN